MQQSYQAMTWHAAAWASVNSRLLAGQLPHAILVVGERGVGKQLFSEALAHKLVCEEPQGPDVLPCGSCKQCQLIAADSHPDVRVYTPEKSRMIKVDQVRALSGFAVASPQVARRKVIVVDRADQLNINAGNALLKTLEEPTADSILILLQETGRPVLPTIRSRCQSLVLPTPGPEAAAQWLEAELAGAEEEVSPSTAQVNQALIMARFAPRLALEFLSGNYVTLREEALSTFRRFMKSEIPAAEAARPFKTLGPEATLWLMELWASDLARISAGGLGRDSEAADMLGFLASSNPPWRAHELLDAIREARSAQVYNANPELEAERLLIQWLGLMPERKRRVSN